MKTSRSIVWLGVALLAAPALAQTAAERVTAARGLVGEGKFKEAVVELDALSRLPNNDRPTVVALYELSGLAYGGLKQAQKARAAFQKLLVLEPAFKLTGKVPPKTAAFFKDAKRAVTQAGGGGLKAEQLTPELKGGRVNAVYASVEKDPAQLAKVVRWHLKIDGGPWVVKEVPAQETTNVEAGGKTVQWWLEVLGENAAVLFVLGSEAAPLVDPVPAAAPPKPAPAVTAAPPKAAPPKADAPVVEAKPVLAPEPKVEPEPVVAATPYELKAPGPVSLTFAGAGVATAGVGAVFGVLSANTRSSLANLPVDPVSGYVTRVTRADALELEKQAQTNAIVANTLMGVGAGLVVGGVIAWLAGGK